jgi:hypothetical protein
MAEGRWAVSRLGDIQEAVGVHVTAAFTADSQTVTLSYDPDAFDNVPKDQLPFARILFVEEEPERLDFKQERRRISGEVVIAMFDATREDVNLMVEDIRDLIFADKTLSASVDDITCEAGIALSTPDDPLKYGTLDIATERIPTSGS